MTWRETIAPDEAARFESYGQEIRALQAAHAKGDPPERTLHTKGHLGAVGTLTLGEAPPALRAGVFATPRSFPVYVRFSNGNPGRHGDHGGDIRGVALKLVGVDGKKLIPGLEDAPTQDLLFIQMEALGLKGTDEFMTLLRAMTRGKALLLPRLIGGLGLRATWRVVSGLAKLGKIRSMATTRFYTAVPIACGEMAIKLSLVPKAAPAASPGKLGPDGLRADLVSRLKSGPLAWSLQAQAFVDEATTPIEDASLPWPADRAPWVELGELVLPPQDVTTPTGQAIEADVERMSFDPWHALVAHRPLGSIMRGRAVAYRESVLGRGAAPEPSSVPTPSR